MKPGEFALNTLTGEYGEVTAVDSHGKNHAIFAADNSQKETLVRVAYLQPVDRVASSSETLDGLNSVSLDQLKDYLQLKASAHIYDVSWIPYLKAYEVSYRDDESKTEKYSSKNLSLENARQFIASLGGDNV